jgi:hypothetical protein
MPAVTTSTFLGERRGVGILDVSAAEASSWSPLPVDGSASKAEAFMVADGRGEKNCKYAENINIHIDN